MTLRIDDINGLENVQPENFADDEQLRAAIDGAVEQGRQGWGVKREQAYLLQAARQLRAALVVAGKADEAQRTLKGEQMSHGRTKKRLSEAEVSYSFLEKFQLQQKVEIVELQNELKALAEDTNNTVTLDR